jgi:hypothetical protein
MTVSSTELSAVEALGVPATPAPAEPEKYSGTDSERAQP